MHTIPTCRFNPTCPEEIGEALVEIEKTQCPFAVKSGGHAAFRGGSNIPGGMTIDLSRLDQIELSADKKMTRTGTGNRWEDVYAKLDPLGVAVVGGRNGDLGVGGFTLGGQLLHNTCLKIFHSHSCQVGSHTSPASAAGVATMSRTTR